LRTLRRRPDIVFELVWRPFLLNPDMPRVGMARPDYVVRKFGGEDRARRLYATISEVGRNEGVLFRFDRIRRTPSSIDAHRLVLELHVTDAELARRRAAWKQPAPRYTRGVLAKFARHSSSASFGAVLDKFD